MGHPILEHAVAWIGWEISSAESSVRSSSPSSRHLPLDPSFHLRIHVAAVMSGARQQILPSSPWLWLCTWITGCRWRTISELFNYRKSFAAPKAMQLQRQKMPPSPVVVLECSTTSHRTIIRGTSFALSSMCVWCASVCMMMYMVYLKMWWGESENTCFGRKWNFGSKDIWIPT